MPPTGSATTRCCARSTKSYGLPGRAHAGDIQGPPRTDRMALLAASRGRLPATAFLRVRRDRIEGEQRQAGSVARGSRARPVSLFADVGSILHGQPAAVGRRFIGRSRVALARRDEADVAEAAAAITQAARWARCDGDLPARSAASSQERRRSASTSRRQTPSRALFLIAPEAAAQRSRRKPDRCRRTPVRRSRAGPAGAREPADERHQAIESARRTSALTVSAKLSGAEVMFDVCDTGPASNSNRSISFSSRFHEQIRRHGNGPHGRTLDRRRPPRRIWARGEPGAGCCFSFALPAHPRTTGPAA